MKLDQIITAINNGCNITIICSTTAIARKMSSIVKDALLDNDVNVEYRGDVTNGIFILYPTEKGGMISFVVSQPKLSITAHKQYVILDEEDNIC